MFTVFRCRKLPKGLKEWRAFKDLMKKIDDFNQVCPLLERMSDKSMMDRHWKRIEDITGHKFDVESEGFQLRHVMDAPLLEHLEDIEVDSTYTYTCTQHIKPIGKHSGEWATSSHLLHKDSHGPRTCITIDCSTNSHNVYSGSIMETL